MNKLNPDRDGPGHQLSVRIPDGLLQAINAELAREREARPHEHVVIGDIVRRLLGKALDAQSEAAVGPRPTGVSGRLAKLRKKRGWTVEQLAGELGVGLSTMSLGLRDQRHLPDAALVKAIALLKKARL